MKQESECILITLPPEFKDKNTRPVYMKQIVRIEYSESDGSQLNIPLSKFTLDQANSLEVLKQKLHFGFSNRVGLYSWRRLIESIEMREI